MRDLLAENGLTVDEIMTMYTLFTTYQVRQKMLQEQAAPEKR